MVEFLVRLGLAALGVGLTAAFAPDQFDLAWKVGSIFAAYSLLTWQMERREMRNPGISGFIAVADAAVVALMVARLGGLEQFGFLVLAPCAYAAARHGSNPAAMAPIATAWILVAANLTSKAPPSNSLLAQAVAVLAVGLLLSQARIVMTVTRQIEPPAPQPTEGPEPIHFLELRENFRRLRDYARDLERKSRRDRLAVQLFDASKGHGEKLHQRLAKTMQEITGADGLTLHTASQVGDLMVVRGTTGEFPEAIESVTFDIGHGLSEYQLRMRMDQKLRALRDEASKQVSGSVLLRDRGKLVGMLCISRSNTLQLEESIAKAQEAAPYLAALIQEELAGEELRRRLAELETLYGIAATTNGAETPVTLSSRVVRELYETMGLQHIAVHAIDGLESIQLAGRGAQIRLAENLNFGNSTGIRGWLQNGADELYFQDAPNDPHLDRLEALKRRVGSFCLIPIQFGAEPYGFLTATTNAVGGLDLPEISTLRAVTAELSRAIARLECSMAGPEGLCTPKEFQEAVGQHPFGCLVYLEPIRLDELIATFGKPALDHAARTQAHRLLSQLPAGGLLCRRPEGDLVAYLRDVEETFARSWANEATTLASMAPLKTPDGRVRVPYGIRAKVARLAPTEMLLKDPQTHQFSRVSAS